jgi:hypothetical protein
VPAEQRVRCHQRRHRRESLAAEHFSVDGQPSALVVVEQNPSLAERFLEELVLGAEGLDDFLLPPIHSGRQDEEKELPRLEDEFHCSPDVVQGKPEVSDV